MANNKEATVTALPEQGGPVNGGIVAGPAEAVETELDQRPPIVRYFEKLGVVRGARFAEVHTVHGKAIEGAIVKEVIGCNEPPEVCIVFGEPGLPTEHLVRWAQVERLVRG